MSEGVFYLERLSSHDELRRFWLAIKNFIETRKTGSIELVIGPAVAPGAAIFVFIRRVEFLCAERGVELHLRWEDPAKGSQFSATFDVFRAKFAFHEQPSTKVSWLTRLLEGAGHWVFRLCRESVTIASFVGRLTEGVVGLVFRPRRFRVEEWLFNIEHVGAGAMPIVGVMSFLIGLVTAFQASVQLRQFGANIFVADLVALAMVRELSPLITAILMAGRTTSAFTAEIGTMKINEELDALKTLNVDIFDFLVIPKTGSSLIAGPLLTAWSFFTGLLGGMTVGYLSLEVSPRSFMREVYGILTVADVWVGFLKSIFFAFIVGVTGCYMGLATEHGADSVGRQTTEAVIKALFFIILADAFVTVLAHVFNW